MRERTRPNMFEELDDRQKLLGGITLLLILVHMIFPKAGIDAATVGMMGVLVTVLYGREVARGLRIGCRVALDAPERRAAAQTAAAPSAQPDPPVSEPTTPPSPAQSELAERIRNASYQAEHARVAAAIEGQSASSRMGDIAQGVVERSGGQARVALMLMWGTIEQRLLAASGLRDATAASRRLVETGRAPEQLAEALEMWRRARNDVAQSVNGGTTDDALWALVDIGASLAALIPTESGQGVHMNVSQERPS